MANPTKDLTFAMNYLRKAIVFLFVSFACAANAGSKRLVVAFFDYSEDGVGRASFKSIRAAKYEHACWHRFIEIEGIETAYIENPPKSLDRAVLLAAIRGQKSAASQFSKALSTEQMDGAYAFLLDPSGAYVTLYGIHYQEGAITNSASFRRPESGLVDPAVLSKALCEAGKSMD